MNANLLPAAAALPTLPALPAAASPSSGNIAGTTPATSSGGAPGSAPAGGFAQEFRQAQAAQAPAAAKPNATPNATPKPAAAPKPARNPGAAAAEAPAPRATQARAGTEAPAGATVLRQSPQPVTAAARRSGPRAHAAALPEAEAGMPAADAAAAGPGRKPARRDSSADTPELPNGLASALIAASANPVPEPGAAAGRSSLEIESRGLPQAPSTAAETPQPAWPAAAVALPTPTMLALAGLAQTPGPGATLAAGASRAGIPGLAPDRAAGLHAAPNDRDAGTDALDDPAEVDPWPRPAVGGPPSVPAAGLEAGRSAAPPTTSAGVPEAGQEAPRPEVAVEGLPPLPAGGADAPAFTLPAPLPATATLRAEPASSQAAVPAEVPIPQRFGTPEWAHSVGQQISLLASDGVHNARLHLHPAEMGPISVQITVDGQTAQVHLSAENAQTRQALEQSMPNLASNLRESGLTLTGGGVSEQPRQPAQQPANEARAGTAGGAQSPAEGPGAGVPVDAPRPLRRQGVVDLYA